MDRADSTESFATCQDHSRRAYHTPMSTPSNPATDAGDSSPPGEHSEAVQTPADPAPHQPPAHPGHPRRKVLIAVAALVIVGALAVWYFASGGTVSTDDAFVSSHVTLTAPRVGGQVQRVLVED